MMDWKDLISLRVCAREKLINEEVECTVPVQVQSEFLQYKYKTPEVFTEILPNRKQSAGLIEAINIPE